MLATGRSVTKSEEIKVLEVETSCDACTQTPGQQPRRRGGQGSINGTLGKVLECTHSLTNKHPLSDKYLCLVKTQTTQEGEYFVKTLQKGTEIRVYAVA